MKNDAQILEETRANHGATKTEFASSLGVTKQVYYYWIGGGRPGVEYLQALAIKDPGTWPSLLAVKLLLARGAAVPCICEIRIGDRGQCPRHPSN